MQLACATKTATSCQVKALFHAGTKEALQCPSPPVHHQSGHPLPLSFSLILIPQSKSLEIRIILSLKIHSSHGPSSARLSFRVRSAMVRYAKPILLHLQEMLVGL